MVATSTRRRATVSWSSSRTRSPSATRAMPCRPRWAFSVAPTRSTRRAGLTSRSASTWGSIRARPRGGSARSRGVPRREGISLRAGDQLAPPGRPRATAPSSDRRRHAASRDGSTSRISACASSRTWKSRCGCTDSRRPRRHWRPEPARASRASAPRSIAAPTHPMGPRRSPKTTTPRADAVTGSSSVAMPAAVTVTRRSPAPKIT